MNNPKLPLIEQARSIVTDSHLGEEDKKLVLERIPYAPTGLLEVFLSACANDSTLLEMMVRNLKRKLMAGDNPAKLREIILSERKELRSLIHATA